MRIIKWCGRESDFKEVMKILRAGGVVVFPTETSYGLGCDPCRKDSVEKIYLIKNRDREKKLPVIASSFFQVGRYFLMSVKERRFAKEHWPGAYTLILRRKDGNRFFLPEYQEVAVRVSGSDLACGLARRLGSPIISTSANLSGSGSLYKIKDLIAQFSENQFKPDMIIDCGNLPPRSASKIARFIDGESVWLR